MDKIVRTVYPAAHVQDNQAQSQETDNASDFQCTCCPPGRSGHRIVVTEDSLYSLGGFNPLLGLGGNQQNIPLERDERGLPLFQELWRFIISTRQWQVLDDFMSVPPTIASHTFAKVGRWLFLFGGTSIPFGETPSSAIYRYDLQASNHSFLSDNSGTREDEVVLRRLGNRWHLVPVTGDVPDERYGHTMTMCYPDVYIVGGTSGYIYNSEVYHLDLRMPTGKWTKLSSDDDPKRPLGRYRHETAFKDKTLYVFGGGTDREAYCLVYIPTFNLESCQWGSLKSVPDPQHGYPSSRKCHSCSQFGNDVYVIGGVSGRSASNRVILYDDIWKFSLQDASWVKFSVKLAVPLYFHSADSSNNDWNTARVDELIKVGRRVKLKEISLKLDIPKTNAYEIVHDKLGYRKVSARWVPKMLSNEHKCQRVEISQILLHQCQQQNDEIVNVGPDGDHRARNKLLEHLITGDETWLHLSTPETKRDSMTWKHPSYHVTKMFKVQQSATKVMATVFWDSRGMILLDILPKGESVNADRYCETLDRLRHVVQHKRPGLLRSGVVLQHDNATPPHGKRHKGMA
ncbi:kelch domain-containing protein 10 [Plakobranchus ocellatus]|uniref:Kelch domain-containing protein 10 n=1 Tax=Plakobranchus ocellatus TaxID=259542 RepID=A0AAV4D8B1_9GAST|nr:kelch domain-containing protein 10 [Plakobranchus ocellatus]